MLDHLLKHALHKLLEEGTGAGLRKWSEITGKKAHQIEGAIQIANQFLAAVKKRSFKSADTYCSAALLENVGANGMKSFFSGLDLRSANWTFPVVDDSSERNKWGNIHEVKLIGALTGLKISNPPESGDVNLSLEMSKEDDGWKVVQISLF